MVGARGAVGETQLEQRGYFRAPKFLVSIGDASYSLYLLHFPMLLLFTEAGLAKGVGGLALYLAATVLAASATYGFYEFPTRRWLRALAPQRDADIAMAASTRGSQP